MKIDLTGQRFGRLVVIKEAMERPRHRRYWVCLCDCGVEKEIAMTSLRSNLTSSCGCYGREKTSQANSKHNMSDTPTYNSWRSMKERCDNPNNSHYIWYGVRGIGYPEEWKEFLNFFEDMGERPIGMTLDRIDVNLNYSKENCKWSTVSEQNLNTGVRKDNAQGVKGVKFTNNRYLAFYRGLEVGRFLTLEEAIEIRKQYENGDKLLTEDQLEKVKVKVDSKREWYKNRKGE